MKIPLRLVLCLLAGLISARSEIVAQLGDLFPDAGHAPVGSHAWPGNNGLNTNNGVGRFGPNAIGLKDTSGSGTWTVGWLENWELSGFGDPLDGAVVLFTMGGWIYPESPELQEPAELGKAQGYSWSGTHDLGWAAYVGFETNTETGVMPWRSNVQSPPFLQWTTSRAVVVDVTFTVGNLSTSNEGETCFFGIWSSAQNSYIGDNESCFPNKKGIPVSAEPSGPLTITAKNIKLANGDSLFFLARSLLNTNGTRFEFQSIEIKTSP